MDENNRTITINDGAWELSCPYDPDIIALVKTTIPTRRWNPARKVWYGTLEYKAAVTLRALIEHQQFICNDLAALEAFFSEKPDTHWVSIPDGIKKGSE